MPSVWVRKLEELFPLTLAPPCRTLGVPGQLPPVAVVDAEPGQAGGAAAGGRPAPSLPSVAQLQSSPRLPNLHPAGQHQDDHGAPKGTVAAESQRHLWGRLSLPFFSPAPKTGPRLNSDVGTSFGRFLKTSLLHGRLPGRSHSNIS